MGDPPSSSVGSIPSARPRSLAEVQALLHSNGDTSYEWDQLLTTSKSIAEANTDSSVLGWECHHTHFEQEEPGQPQCSQQDCGPGPPREGTRAQEPTQVPMAGRGQQHGQNAEREPGADSSCCSEKPQ